MTMPLLSGRFLRQTRLTHLVLLDLYLPVVNGAQLLYTAAHEQRQLRSHHYEIFK